MKRFNIVNPKKYTTKQGEEKTNWANIGSLIQLDDGKMFIELNHLPGTFQVFEQKPKQQEQPQEQENTEYRPFE